MKKETTVRLLSRRTMDKDTIGVNAVVQRVLARAESFKRWSIGE